MWVGDPAARSGAAVPASAARRLTAADIGCWVIKSQRSPAAIHPGWAGGQERALDRCVRPTYRLQLMEPGQRCLLWLSGRSHPGVHGVGRLLSHAQRPADDHEPDTVGPEVTVQLSLLTTPVDRSLMLGDPVLREAEVIRMPAGSNPSYLSIEQLAALRCLLDESDLPPGW